MDHLDPTPFDVTVHEDAYERWIVEAIATEDPKNQVRQALFIGQDARVRAHSYAARKYGHRPA